jgi:hypothetical protein
MKVNRHNQGDMQRNFYRITHSINDADDVCLSYDVSYLEMLCYESETLLHIIFGECYSNLPDDIKDSIIALLDKHSAVKKILRMDKSRLTPLLFDEWCYETRIEEKYQMFHDEYGDAAGDLFRYKEYHYNEYLEEFEHDLKMEFGDIKGLLNTAKKS